MGVCATVQGRNIVDSASSFLSSHRSIPTIVKPSSFSEDPELSPSGARRRTVFDNAPGLPLDWYLPGEYTPLSNVDITNDWFSLQRSRQAELAELSEEFPPPAPLPSEPDLDGRSSVDFSRPPRLEIEECEGEGEVSQMQMRDPAIRFHEILSSRRCVSRRTFLDSLRQEYIALFFPTAQWKTTAKQTRLVPSSIDHLKKSLVKETESSFKFIESTEASDLLPSVPKDLLRTLQQEAQWHIAIAKKVIKVKVYMGIEHLSKALRIYEERLGGGIWTDAMEWSYETLVSLFKKQQHEELLRFWLGRKRRALLRHASLRAKLCEDRREWEIAARLYLEALQEVQYDDELEDGYLNDEFADWDSSEGYKRCCRETASVLAALARCHKEIQDLGRARVWLCRYMRQTRCRMDQIIKKDVDNVEGVRAWITQQEELAKRRAMDAELARIRKVRPKVDQQQQAGSESSLRKQLPVLRQAWLEVVDLEAERKLEEKIAAEIEAKRNGVLPFLYQKLASRLARRDEGKKAIGMFEKGIAVYFAHLMTLRPTKPHQGGRITLRVLESHFRKLQAMVDSLLDLLIGDRDYRKSLVYYENFKLFRIKCLVRHGLLSLPMTVKLDYLNIRKVKSVFEESEDVKSLVIYRVQRAFVHCWVFGKVEGRGTRVVFKKIELPSETFFRDCAAGLSDSFSEDAMYRTHEEIQLALYEVLIQRIRKYFPTKRSDRVIFILDPKMRNVQIHALKSSDSRRHLLEDFSVSVFSSFGLMNMIASRPAQKGPGDTPDDDSSRRPLRVSLLARDEVDQRAFASSLPGTVELLSLIPLEHDPSALESGEAVEGEGEGEEEGGRSASPPFDLVVQLSDFVDGIPDKFCHPKLIVISSTSEAADWMLAGAEAMVIVSDIERVEEVSKKLITSRGRVRNVLLSYLRHEGDRGLLRFRGFATT